MLPSPRHFEQATQLVTEQHIASSLPCGPDPEEHAAAIQAYVDAGFDEIYVGQIGPGHDGFVEFYVARDPAPLLGLGLPVGQNWYRCWVRGVGFAGSLNTRPRGTDRVEH